MEFRIATDKDFEFVMAHALHPESEKESPVFIDFDYALENKGVLFGVGGFRQVTPTTAWAYFSLTEYVGNHVIVCYRIISEWIDIWCKDHGIIRLQAWVDIDFEDGHRTVRHLDFKKESTLQDFCGKGKHAIMYARIFDGDK